MRIIGCNCATIEYKVSNDVAADEADHGVGHRCMAYVQPHVLACKRDTYMYGDNCNCIYDETYVFVQ